MSIFVFFSFRAFFLPKKKRKKKLKKKTLTGGDLGLDDAQPALLGQQVRVHQVNVGRRDLLEDPLDDHRAQQARVEVVAARRRVLDADLGEAAVRRDVADELDSGAAEARI